MPDFRYQPQPQSQLLSLPAEVLSLILLHVLADEKPAVTEFHSLKNTHSAYSGLHSAFAGFSKDDRQHERRSNDLGSLLLACAQTHDAILATIGQYYPNGLRLKLEICAISEGSRARAYPIWLSMPAVFRKMESLIINYRGYIKPKPDHLHELIAMSADGYIYRAIRQILLFGPGRLRLTEVVQTPDARDVPPSRCSATIFNLVIDFDLIFGEQSSPEHALTVERSAEFLYQELNGYFMGPIIRSYANLCLYESVGCINFTIQGREFRTFSLARELKAAREWYSPSEEPGELCPFISFWTWKTQTIAGRQQQGLPVFADDIGPTKEEIEHHRDHLHRFEAQNCSHACTVAGWKLPIV